ncbi:MAG TPA: radical SAM protein [Chloroflexi bacterium]|nr:radical SAM protein [Chloroflexota bacterium]
MLALEDVAADLEDFRQAVQEGVPYRPLYVKIKLTWRCNLRCRMCNVWRQDRGDRLTLQLIRSLADELAALGTKKVHLSGGEVLLRSDIFEVIRAFASKGIQVNLTTNGTLLTPEVAARLVESGISNVSVSLDGATPSVHDAMRGTGTWKRTLTGIRNLRQAAKAAHRKVHIRINTVITRCNYRDLARLPEIAHYAGADRLTLIPVDDPDGQLRLNKRRIREYTEEIAPLIAHHALAYGMIEKAEEVYPFGRSKAEWELSKAGLYARGLYQEQPCYMPWLHSLIDPKGRVYPCCMTRSLTPLGNVVKRGGFTPVWEGEAFRSFRLGMLKPEGRPSLCHCCDDFLEENRYLHRKLAALSGGPNFMPCWSGGEAPAQSGETTRRDRNV